MAKATKTHKPNGPPAPANRDLFQRVNFTYQASILLQNLASSSGSTPTSDPDTEPDIARLGRNGIKATKKMIVHNQLKMCVFPTSLVAVLLKRPSDPSLKRTICRHCSTVLVPGLTCKIRNRRGWSSLPRVTRGLSPSDADFCCTANKSHSEVIHQTCFHCTTVLTIPAPPLPSTPSPFDGPVRTSRREKRARRTKAAFFQREQDSGHGLWKGDERLANWGTDLGDTSISKQ
ncbi:ribonuclease P protein subunit RPR2, partial [Tremellales sp. Uapishka_1]